MNPEKTDLMHGGVGRRRWFLQLAAATLLAACGSNTPQHKPVATASRRLAPVRIRHISREAGGQELMLHGMSLIGTPYRYGGGSREAGFDCSGMVHYLYRTALQVDLPRTARDIAAVSQPIREQDLRPGDLVFFNTNGQRYSHMGLYIGNGAFIHAPSSRGSIRTAQLSQAYFRQRLTGTHTLFAL